MSDAAPPPKARSGLAWARAAGRLVVRHHLTLGRFLRLVWRRGQREQLGLRASALAFTTIVALVPLVAAYTRLATQLYKRNQPHFLELLREVLPYSETAIVSALEGFVAQAESISGLGIAGFLVVSALAFLDVEKTINRTWNVATQRPWRFRLISYCMLVLAGPALIGAGWWLLVELRGNSGLATILEGRLSLSLFPVLFTAVGLTLLYWLVPSARVRPTSALLGGTVTSLALEALRLGYAAYLGYFGKISRLVYGGFSAAFFFMLSLQVGWWLILTGNEVAYCHQHRAELLPTPTPSPDTLARPPRA